MDFKPFIVVDPDESSYLMEPSYLDKEPSVNPFRPPLPVGNPSFAKRNLCNDFESDNSATLLPVPTSKETIQVYLRVKPKTLEESEISLASGSNENREESSAEESEVIKIESEHQLAMNAPKESNTYKNSMNGAGQLIHRFAFSKIFPPETDQAEFFREMVLPRMRDLMEGQNQLLFTYGATSSGKTYTIQGNRNEPGILPRALDVIFNSIGDRQMVDLKLKPNCFNRVVQMKEKDIRKLEEDKQGVFHLGLELVAAHQQDKRTNHLHGPDSSKISGISKLSEDTFNAADMTNLTQDSLAAMFPDLPSRVCEDAAISLKHDDINYAVWISFAEIYNESIYDLLEKIPPVKRKGDKPKRSPLKLAEDKNGSIYIKGLKEIKVNSANEAYQVMMIGRENLHFAATRLNHQSSRSHCIFTIKVIRVAETAKPHLARVSMLSFCDLAGAERIKKTLNTGERQKEAGNINTSLLVLGRCMKAIRHNQIVKEKKKHQMVPFRESKLTRMFQSFLVGYGKASMVVNVSQAPYLFDETIQVMKFAAVTSKITVVQLPATPPTVVKQPNRKRKTRFSMMVEDHQAKRSNCTTLMGRGSIAWEKPAARSTMCFARAEEATIEETITEDDEAEASVMDATMVDQRYEGLLKLVDDLKEQLIKEKQKNITLEKEVRTELCDEFNGMLVEVEKDWEKRLQDERERTEELNEWRINKVQEVYKAKRKRQRRDDDDDEDLDETAVFQKAETEIALEERTTELRCQEEKLAALQEQHSALAKEKAKQQEELAKRERELVKERVARDDAIAQLVEAQKELEAMKNSEASKTTDPIIEDLKRQVEEGKAKADRLEKEKANLKELLDDAGEDFLEKNEELEKVQQAAREQEQAALAGRVALAEVTTQLEEARMLLQDSAARMDEKETVVTELEEQVEELKGRLEEKEKRVDDLEKERDSLRQVEEKSSSERERVERELNDEIEELKAAKKKIRTELEEKSKAQEGVEKETKKLEREIKSLIQAEKQQRQTTEDSQAEVAMLRKQVKELGAKEAAAKKAGEAALREKETEVEKLNIEVTSLRKEGHALELVGTELKARTEERDRLAEEVKGLKNEVETKGYDFRKLKEERDAMMTTYEQRLKKTTEELNMEKREALKMREVMSRSTPGGGSANGSSNSKLARRKEDRLAEDNRMMREELQRKTDVIKKLELMIPAKKELRYPSSGDEAGSESEAETLNLKSEVVRLQKELEDERVSHARELSRAKKAQEKKVVEMYKNTNLDLQRQASSTSATSGSATATDHSTLEADQSANGGADVSLVEETPRGKKRARRTGAAAVRGRARKANNKTDSASQASFEDSTAENDPEEENRRPQPRRSTRLKRSRPVRKTRSNSTNNSTTHEDSPSRQEHPSVLQAIQESSEEKGKRTPSSRKRQLYNHESTGAAEQFTPPTAESMQGPTATPRTVVKRQLRSRSSRKKR